VPSFVNLSTIRVT